jgi:phosphonate transport system permease protein
MSEVATHPAAPPLSDAPRGEAAAPPRFTLPGAPTFLVYLLTVAFFAVSLGGTGWSLAEFVKGLPNMWRLLGEMLPPSPGRLAAVLRALLETFQMAYVGCAVGVLLSLPLAVLATRSLSPTYPLYVGARSLIALFRTVPDLVWALFFVATVGLGPFAGALTIVVDTIGFCGRFFAEAMEEVDKGVQEALAALGASRLGVVACAVVPGAFPSFINSALFSLEKATRSSVVLGLVGAGGIGIELKVSMDMFEYAEASTIILCIFALVVGVERMSSYLRRRII